MDAMSYLIMLQQLDQLMQIDQQDSGYHLVVLVTQMQMISIPNGKWASWIILSKDLLSIRFVQSFDLIIPRQISPSICLRSPFNKICSIF